MPRASTRCGGRSAHFTYTLGPRHVNVRAAQQGSTGERRREVNPLNWTLVELNVGRPDFPDPGALVLRMTSLLTLTRVWTARYSGEAGK